MARQLIPATESPESAAAVAQWLVDEWAHLYPQWDHAAAVAELLGSGDAGSPPQTWLLFEEIGDRPADRAGTLIGSIGLGLDGELPEPSPRSDTNRSYGEDGEDSDDGDDGEHPSGVWVVNLFVTPSARGRGHGTALLDHAVAEALSMGISELLLTTEHSADHYATLGWRRTGAIQLNGHESVLMRLSTMSR
jgi:GNAT superfamily N-acetyltransferase